MFYLKDYSLLKAAPNEKQNQIKSIPNDNKFKFQIYSIHSFPWSGASVPIPGPCSVDHLKSVSNVVSVRLTTAPNKSPDPAKWAQDNPLLPISSLSLLRPPLYLTPSVFQSHSNPYMVNKAFSGCSFLNMFFFSEQLKDLCICASDLQFKPPGIANYIIISLSDLGKTKNSMRAILCFYTFISRITSSSMLGKSWDSGSPASTTLSKLFSMLWKFSHSNRTQTPERSSCWSLLPQNRKIGIPEAPVHERNQRHPSHWHEK